ncbi:dipeptidase [Melanogaster broomeanus]|nr:dipeptidase [Melanogaster broomeanus]
MRAPNAPPQAPKHANANGLGEAWDPHRPTFRGLDLTKADPRLKVPSVEIRTGSDDTVIAFVDVNIIDSTGAAPYRGDVLVKGKRIVSVGSKIASEVLQGARVFEGRGRTLMSGLCDSHAHTSFINSATLDGITALPVEEHAVLATRSARQFLDSGYTMCLGAAAAKPRLDLVVRNAIQAGDIPGPRYLASGQEMAPRDGALAEGITTFVETTDDIVKTISSFADAGVDVVKLSMSGDELLEELRAEDSTFSDELVAAGVEAAHAKGIRVCSHARSDESIRQCLQYGIDIIYHGSFISDESMDALEAQKNRVYFAPAMNLLYMTLLVAEKTQFGFKKSDAEKYKRELDICIAALKEMKKRGIRILPGGDYGFAWAPHGSYQDLELFVNLLGFTPMEAILSATALGGEIMMHPHELGKVQPGYYADLILVDGNPLEDISVLTPTNGKLDLIMIVRIAFCCG